MRAAVVLLLFAVVGAAASDPPLQELARLAGTNQGVFAEAEDGTVLVAQAADRAVHPASVTKVATSLALLAKLGPTHRFDTRVLATGPLHGGALGGDLVVEASRDPFLVDEGAALLATRLHALGIRSVDGRLVVHGPLLFDWQPDPDGKHLARELAAPKGAAPVAIRGRPARPEPSSPRPLLLYRSPPLVHVVKMLNCYSNNVFHLVSPVIGGPPAVEAFARAHVPPAMRDEIVIDDAAGGGETNRLSPRAAVALLRALTQEVEHEGHHLSDVLPVSGVDPGTLEERLVEPEAHRRTVVGKTGTFGSVGASALAGVLHTKRWGTVAFAVLNHGVPVPEARQRQDAFVHALVDATAAEPWPYDTPAHATFTAAEIE
jgi:D-alanyl-D-alanine carboxypeptidase/D-alanyl-D-alanine-endopeptidase (penicillin-binding protein 4)